MTAVEEPVEGFFGDRPVRVALPPAVLRELPQDPFLDLEPVSAGVAHSDEVCDQPGQHDSQASCSRRGPVDDVFDVQRATAQPFDIEPQVVRLGRVAGCMPQHGRHHR